MKANLILFFMFVMVYVSAQTDYQLPPREILDLADVQSPPQNLISAKNTYLIQLQRPQYKSLEELAEPELKLAGLRINPQSFNRTRINYINGIAIQKIKDGTPVVLTGMPKKLKAVYFTVSPDERYCAFVQVNGNKLSLWTINLQTGQAKEIVDEGVNATLGSPYTWSGNSNFIFCKWIGNKKPFSTAIELPKGPATQDATGEKAPARTYQDLLKNKQDEARFDHYTSAYYLKVSVDGTEKSSFLQEAIYTRFSISPNGKYIITEQIVQPYSYTLTYDYFASRINILDSTGKLVKTIYNRPLQDKVPLSFDAVESGKRNFMWRNDKPSILMWCVAPDGGDPEKESEFRDQLFQSEFPFEEEKSVCFLKNRFNDIEFGNDKITIVSDYWWKNRNTKTYLIDPSVEGGNPKIIFDLSSEDLYSNPGYFYNTYNSFNRQVLQFSKDGKKLYLIGEGYSPQGNKPFIDEFDIITFKSVRLWQADGKSTYETVFRIIDFDKKTAITSIESPKVYPNLYIRNYGGKNPPKQITFNQNPYLSLQNISKQKIFYKRNDGVNLSATLYLPAGYDKSKKGRLPMLMEAYPTEYKDDKAAGQISDSPHRFISLYWGSPVYWVTRGYAVVEDAQFPIVGKGNDEPNDTYIEQLVANAAALIHTLDSMGVVDPNRCAAMGHSYGAFMTANLLAHSDLFAAGIARSGAYNRSLTPFGFQSEERTYWQAQDIYIKMSPFNYADKIMAPLLLIHGDADNNPGTFTLQSERLFQAVKGNGGKARLVLLPYESHGYAARENILHMLWEMDTWLEKFVKNK
ncbi:MAG: prolyl oligopeptidase family serine peptidase [Bacteroidales bacterium]